MSSPEGRWDSSLQTEMEKLCAGEESAERKSTSSTTSEKEGEESTPRNSADEAGASCTDDTAETKEKLSEEDDNTLSLITWNVDGLDGENQPERARALCSYLIQHSPDVVLLQELIQPYVRFVYKRLAVDYTYIEGGKENYFTGMMLKKSRITLLDSEIVSYPTTQMMRNLLVAQVLFRGQKLCLMTSHFESCKDSAEERMRQLQLVMRRMSEAPGDVSVLFGGDTNLRAAEVAKVGLPSSVCDVWEQLGYPVHCRYTWDTRLNTNKAIPFNYHFRFDRVYLRRAHKDGAPRLNPASMALVGQEKLKCGRYTSDHWGIYCTFSAE
ncbi:tyrosyl-DNA phosphodiesterase 2-like [Toxotes jaculatrix]|uniref:tyrosyl-DNA phosphodiesterase 2-like n=1 Tax=Toxotes jaculatrix TaxID=941984 RepID=UPI001B3A9815|nr:tyrosyl-DNA phosphodiesterase 2-like [Toxotes jaculatrix]